jgi:hypothetical protein
MWSRFDFSYLTTLGLNHLDSSQPSYILTAHHLRRGSYRSLPLSRHGNGGIPNGVHSFAHPEQEDDFDDNAAADAFYSPATPMDIWYPTVSRKLLIQLHL